MWIVYLLFDPAGRPFYVGSTCNPKRRMKEHRTDLGFSPTYEVLARGTDPSKRSPTERRWINEMRARGAVLKNKLSGYWGRWSHSSATRQLLSQKGKGVPKPPGFGQKLSSATKGKPHNWTADGRRRAKLTQFKKGISLFRSMTPEEQDRIREASRRQWDGVSPEERSRRSRERNLQTWANRTPEQRSAIGRKIADARRRNAEAAA